MNALIIAVWLAIGIAVLSGCAAEPSPWQKPGISDAEAKSEVTECRYEAQLNRLEDATLEGLIENCMQGKGFRERSSATHGAN